MMGQFKREERYRVLKLSDVENALTTDELFYLNKLSQKVDNYREVSGKIPLECVCPESDWPIYEDVWGMVQRLAEGKPQVTEELTETIKQLEARIARLKIACQLGIDMFSANDINVPNTIETMQNAVDETPQQSTAEIQAAAIAEYGRHCYTAFINGGEPLEPDGYADELRQKAKGGSNA